MTSDKLKIIRKKTDRRIDSQATFHGVWEQIELLKNPQSVKNILKRSINKKFYGLDFLSTYKSRNQLSKCKEGKPDRFIENVDLNKASIKVVTSIKQAQEYYIAARSATSLTKPVFLYYGMISLSKALTNATFYISKPVNNHGLRTKSQLDATILRTGAFQSFRDAYIGDTQLYTNPQDTTKIKLKDLLAVIPGIANEWEIAYNNIFDDLTTLKKVSFDIPNKQDLKTSNGTFKVIYGDDSFLNDEKHLLDTSNDKFVHVIDAHFISMFILCHFARYKPTRWIEIMNKDSNSFIFNSFLSHSELDFPMLIYNEITGIRTYFMPFARIV